MDGIDNDFIDSVMTVMAQNNPRAYNKKTKARGVTQITPSAWDDLVAFYPEKYLNQEYETAMLEPNFAMEAGKDYLSVIKSYLRFYKIPITFESLVGAYAWGIANLKQYGIEGAPNEIKYYMAKIRHLKQPQAEALDANSKL